jgi:GTP-binding protein
MLIAVVGRPNVGKSTFFNKIIGQRISIVEDTPGVTRDRIYAKGEHSGKPFTLIDTGGLEISPEDDFKKHINTQIDLAITQADVIIFLTDVRSGVTAADIEVAELLRRTSKPIVLAVNKCDSVGTDPPELYEFYNLGIGDPYPVSSVHGHGTSDILDECFSYYNDITEEYPDDYIKVAVIGQPNSGKSSLINKILGEKRLIVSEIAGTTRDSVDTVVKNGDDSYVFVDTAGIRRKNKISENIEKYSVIRSYSAIDNSDVCVMLIDAVRGFSETDSKIAGYAHEQGKAIIIAVNKWDLVEKDDHTMVEYRRTLEEKFKFMAYVPFIFISAKTGQRIGKLYELIKYVYEQNAMRFSTGMLNEVLNYATSRVQPPSDKGKRLKLYYITQPETKPPTFVIFVNRADIFHFSYQRYIENQIRATFGLEGTPIRLIIREREEKGRG